MKHSNNYSIILHALKSLQNRKFIKMLMDEDDLEIPYHLNAISLEEIQYNTLESNEISSCNVF